MSRFVAGDADFVAPDADLPLVTAKRLLRVLNVASESPEVQAQAVRKWLADHTPDPILRRSLVAAGLIEADPAEGVYACQYPERPNPHERS